MGNIIKLVSYEHACSLVLCYKRELVINTVVTIKLNNILPVIKFKDNKSEYNIRKI